MKVANIFIQAYKCSKQVSKPLDQDKLQQPFLFIIFYQQVMNRCPVLYQDKEMRTIDV